MKAVVVPTVGAWYHDRELNTHFEVIAVDENDHTIEIQDFDGSVDEFDMDTWRSMALEITPEPEDFSGALDIGEIDDFGTEITDTAPEDWRLGPLLSESHEASGYDEEQQLTDWMEAHH